MSTSYEATPRCSAVGVTTASILVVILAMGASTLFEASRDAPAVASGHASVKVVRSHDGARIRNS